MRLLLISNSTMAGEAYLDYPKHEIKNFLGEKPVKALFIPYAGVTFSFDDYEKKVKERFNEVGHDVVSIHTFGDPVRAVREAEAIVVGGGNTWQLVKMIHDDRLIEAVREKVMHGTPYIGWSAGANVACPTIKTTNDMPISEPDSFRAFDLVRFQINPHYLDANPDGHAGETRQDRIMEFLHVNRDTTVLGLREGCMFRIEDGGISLIGKKSVRVFHFGNDPYEIEPGGDLSAFL